MLESLSGSVVWWWSYTCTLINGYAVYAHGCSLSVTCQVAMVKTLTTSSNVSMYMYQGSGFVTEFSLVNAQSH